MVTMIRSAAIAPGKAGDAVQFAYNVTKFIHDKYGVKIHIMMPIGGNPNRIGWQITYESVADWDALGSKLLADPEYGAMVAANAATFIPGSVHDDLWKSI